MTITLTRNKALTSKDAIHYDVFVDGNISDYFVRKYRYSNDWVIRHILKDIPDTDTSKEAYSMKAIKELLKGLHT